MNKRMEAALFTESVFGADTPVWHDETSELTVESFRAARDKMKRSIGMGLCPEPDHVVIDEVPAWMFYPRNL